MNKSHLRKTVLIRLKSMSSQERSEQSDQLVHRLKQLSVLQKSEKILLYVSKEYEVHTHELIRELIGDKEVFVPKVHAEENKLEIYPLASWDDLEEGRYGVLEPLELTPVSVTEMDCVLVPGVAFTRDGKRLGHGKGYYDMLLAHSFDIPTIALAYREQIIDDLPMEEHDVKIDTVLSL